MLHIYVDNPLPACYMCTHILHEEYVNIITSYIIHNNLYYRYSDSLIGVMSVGLALIICK